MTDKDALNHLAKAANALRTARETLEKVQTGCNWISNDAAYYKAEIDELISCDNGEGGLDALITLMANHIEKKG